jgi:hypothetical protein
MNFFWRVKKKPETPADELLEEIKNMLFPPLKVDTTVDEMGSPIKFHVDFSVDSNLDAALMDLQDGHNDAATQKTIDTITKRLHRVRKMLEAYPELDTEAKYIIVDDGSSEDDPQELQAREYR